jgi:hypothetical protein
MEQGRRISPWEETLAASEAEAFAVPSKGALRRGLDCPRDGDLSAEKPAPVQGIVLHRRVGFHTRRPDDPSVYDRISA